MNKYTIKLCYVNLDMEKVKQSINVESIEDGSKKVRQIIMDECVYASGWYGAKVYEENKLIGEIAYNGRFID